LTGGLWGVFGGGLGDLFLGGGVGVGREVGVFGWKGSGELVRREASGSFGCAQDDGDLAGWGLRVKA
jgi:hypothetical protein